MHCQFHSLMKFRRGINLWKFRVKLLASPQCLQTCQCFPLLSSGLFKFQAFHFGGDPTLNNLDAEFLEQPCSSGDQPLSSDKTTLWIQNLLGILSNSSDEELTEALDNCELSLTEDLVLDVLKRHHADWKSAFRFFSWASSISDLSGYTPGSEVHNEMLGILGKAKRFEELLQVFDEMFKRGVVNERSYHIVVHRYAAAHMIDDAISFFFKRRQYGLELDLVAFQTLLMSLCRYKHVETAESLFYSMKGDFQIDIKTWNIILNGWCVRGNLRETKRFWKEILHSQCKPDKYTYGSLINALCKSGKANSAADLLRTMWQKGCSPDVVICNSVIDGLCFKKRIPEALLILRDMNEKGCKPNVATYNCLIKHMCNIRRMEMVLRLLGEMEEKGGDCLPNSTTYSHLLSAAKKPEEVSGLLERMETNGFMLTGDICNLLLRLYMNWECEEQVQSTWTEMLKNGMGPDQRSYTVMIHKRYDQGRIEDALRYYGEMTSKGLNPEPRTKLLVDAMKIKLEVKGSEETRNRNLSRRARGFTH